MVSQRIFRRRESWLLVAMVLLSFVIASCSFGRETTPEAVNLPVYQPGAETSVTASPLAAGEVVTTTVVATTNNTAAPAAPVAAAGQATALPPSAPTAQPTAATSATESDATGAAVAAQSQATTPAVRGPLIASYAAEIEAVDEVVIVAQVAGQVQNLAVEVGDVVQAGDVLAQIDSTLLEAQRMQALAGVQAAKAQLDGLRTPADAEDLEAARAAVAAASAGYNRAVAGPTGEERRQAQAQLSQAQAAVNVAQAGYNLVRSIPEVGMLQQGLQLQAATLQLEGAQGQFDKLMQGATQDQIAGAYAQLAGAQAQLQRLEIGVDDAQVRAAAAQLRNAENALYLVQLQIDQATVRAPFAGVVARLQTQAGNLAAPGLPLLTLLTPTVNVQIDVDETLLSSLRVGQPAEIYVAAYPEQPFQGMVELIAPQLDPATRTVAVTIRPEDPDGLLKPGMSAQAALFANE